MYRKAGRRMDKPPQAEPEPLQLSVLHATAVFGTDFDVVVEVGVAECWAQAWRRDV